ncbi:FadR/GntR family transcriptional regulator [Caulobacter sp. 602-1]|uniref:FadR/GntR family transcriptional regulator n=1 Tax=unclassified Caulobacter TaxID=2648921 RepID=UPI000F637FD8|nr:FadR/GntR family transcriptional regulator [Caulobacter sp. 602-1]RRN65190.1 FadR family transcriptional regulator [Caulobacter sp. 602-1]
MTMDRRYQQVAKQIIELIESGEFAPGSRLPGERELAERLGVSRVTVREAEIALEAQGYIAVKTGSGVYVRPRRPADLSPLTEVDAFELTTVRAVVEAESAALAALNMTPEAMVLLEDTMRVMAGNDEAAEEADERFHLLIAESSGSPIIEHFVRTLWRMRNEAPRVVQVYSNVCKSGFEDRIEEHRAVYDAIRNRDPNAARLAMREHFSRLFEAMLAAEETEAIVQLRRKALQHRDRFKLSVQHGAA